MCVILGLHYYYRGIPIDDLVGTPPIYGKIGGGLLLLYSHGDPINDSNNIYTPRSSIIGIPQYDVCLITQ